MAPKAMRKVTDQPSSPVHSIMMQRLISHLVTFQRVCVTHTDGKQNTWRLNVFRLCAAGSIYSLMLHNMTFCEHSGSFKGSSIEKNIILYCLGIDIISPGTSIWQNGRDSTTGISWTRLRNKMNSSHVTG